MEIVKRVSGNLRIGLKISVKTKKSDIKKCSFLSANAFKGTLSPKSISFYMKDITYLNIVQKEKRVLLKFQFYYD